MAKRGSVLPVEFNPGVVRSEDIIQLFDQKIVNNTTEQLSDPLPCREFREFLLYLGIDSTSTPTTLQIKVEFLDPWTGKWHTYKQGIFAALFYEDTDTASGIWECFSGQCVGREMRITLTGVGTGSTTYFTVDAAVEFRN